MCPVNICYPCTMNKIINSLSNQGLYCTFHSFNELNAILEFLFMSHCRANILLSWCCHPSSLTMCQLTWLPFRCSLYYLTVVSWQFSGQIPSQAVAPHKFAEAGKPAPRWQCKHLVYDFFSATLHSHINLSIFSPVAIIWWRCSSVFSFLYCFLWRKIVHLCCEVSLWCQSFSVFMNSALFEAGLCSHPGDTSISNILRDVVFHHLFIYFLKWKDWIGLTCIRPLLWETDPFCSLAI